MTRLTPRDLDGIASGVPYLDQWLRSHTGTGLFKIACRAWRLDPSSIRPAGLTLTCVPITAGEGIIPAFADTVAAICCFMGGSGYVPPAADVQGLACALHDQSDVVFVADDSRFISFSPHNGTWVDNGEATGRAFAAALDALAGGTKNKPVLVLGLGDVGVAAGHWLVDAGAEVSCFDLLEDRMERVRTLGMRPVASLAEGLAAHSFVVDATTSADLIDQDWAARPGALVAAPGMPLGVTERARALLEGRLIHEPLALGVAAMLVGTMALSSERNRG